MFVLERLGLNPQSLGITPRLCMIDMYMDKGPLKEPFSATWRRRRKLGNRLSSQMEGLVQTSELTFANPVLFGLC